MHARMQAETQPAPAHRPVMPEACLAALDPRPDGRYCDGTWGRGGHGRALLLRLGPAGRLLALDRDPEAIEDARRLAADEPRLVVCHAAFSALERAVAEAFGPGRVLDGCLLDLGVSSPQLDTAERGFSFLRDGPLDMRMDPGSGIPASAWLATVTEEELADVLFRLGEERHSRRIARAICTERARAPIDTTARLAAIVSAAHPRWPRGHHPATRSFQAIRLHINRELEELEAGLAAAARVLVAGGRLVVLTFHSLEDRIVKRFLRGDLNDDRPHWARPEPPFRPLGRALAATTDEIAANPRARSAHLRVGVRQ
jgi:16S rRNA (cytosine1402-N4)-methyltransferase